MLSIGLTGGIGSGKSIVARVFEVLGIPVYYADEAAKRLMQEDEGLKKKIIDSFGNQTYPDGRLDRKYLSAVVFNDPAKLEVLNALVHPVTLNDARQWLQLQTSAYAVKEAALIFETDAHHMLDYVIGVFAPAPLRIQRVMQRDQVSREEVLSRMNRQMDEDLKISKCNFVIINDEKQMVIPQVLAIHELLTADKAKI